MSRAKRSILISDIPEEVYYAISERMERLSNRIDNSRYDDETKEAQQELTILEDFYNLPKDIEASIDFIQKETSSNGS